MSPSTRTPNLMLAALQIQLANISAAKVQIMNSQLAMRVPAMASRASKLLAMESPSMRSPCGERPASMVPNTGGRLTNNPAIYILEMESSNTASPTTNSLEMESESGPTKKMATASPAVKIFNEMADTIDLGSDFDHVAPNYVMSPFHINYQTRYQAELIAGALTAKPHIKLSEMTIDKRGFVVPSPSSEGETSESKW